MPGSGKSTVGRQLSEKLNLPFKDLDDEIETGEGLVISEIFKKYGEDHFRKLEKEYLVKLLSLTTDFILASGGGTPCFYNNMEAILAGGIAIYLKADISLLMNRLDDNNVSTRPLLNQKTLEITLKEKLTERTSFYSKAHHTVDVNNLVLENIIKILEEKTNGKSH